MGQQTYGWFVLLSALGVGSAILLRYVRPTKERRTIGQWTIVQLYKAARYVWAIVRGLDAGYLEFQQVRRTMALEIQNEHQLGKLIKPEQTERLQSWAA